MNDTQKKSILEMARGAMMERATYETTRIMENILDANTKATAKRKLKDRETVKAFLEDKLQHEIEIGAVIIAL